MSDQYVFRGFSSPRYTQVPDQVFDELAPQLTEAELRVLLYICRRVFGFGKDSDAISISQMVDGIRTRDGRRLDHGTGMSRPGVSRGVKGLVAKGVIVAERTVTEDGVNQVNVYRLRFADADAGVGNDVAYGSKPGLHEVGNEVDPQETVTQQTGERGTKRTPVTPFLITGAGMNSAQVWSLVVADLVSRGIGDRHALEEHLRSAEIVSVDGTLFRIRVGNDVARRRLATYRDEVATALARLIGTASAEVDLVGDQAGD